MRGFTSVIIVGNLVHDPALKYLTSGAACYNISVAVNTRKKVGGEWRDEVHYFDCALFGATAEAAEKHLKKGSAVLISGRLVQSRWEAEGGQKRQRVSIIAEDFRPLGSRGAASSAPDRSAPSETSDPVPDEDIPF